MRQEVDADRSVRGRCRDTDRRHTPPAAPGTNCGSFWWPERRACRLSRRQNRVRPGGTRTRLLINTDSTRLRITQTSLIHMLMCVFRFTLTDLCYFCRDAKNEDALQTVFNKRPQQFLHLIHPIPAERRPLNYYSGHK